MEAAGGLWLQLTVPALVLLMMASMGLELSTADFRRVFDKPKPMLVGLTGQMLLLPCLGLAFALVADLAPEIAVGVMILTACPGGAPSNVFTYLAGANLALSISLTAVASLMSFVSIPLWVSGGFRIFLGEDALVHLPLAQTIGQLFGVTVLPVGVGMLLRSRYPQLAERLRPRVKRIVAILVGAATVLIVVSQWEVLVRDFRVAASSAFTLVLLALGLAYMIARLAAVSAADAFTISVEVGLQNGALASMIAVNLLARPDLVVFPAAYALVAFVPVGLWTIVYRMRSRRAVSSPLNNSSVSESEQFFVGSRSDTGGKALALLRMSRRRVRRKRAARR